MRNFKLKLLLGLIGLSSLSLANADTVTSNIEVSTTVTASCSITTDIAEIAIPNATHTDTVMESPRIKLTPKCTKGTSYSVSSNNGLSGSGVWSYFAQTAEPTIKLQYQLIMWRNGSSSAVNKDAVLFSEVGDGHDGVADQSFEFHAQIMKSYGLARATAGTYSDTVTITVTY